MGGWAKRRQSFREKWSQEGWETQGAERTKPGNVAKVLSWPHASKQRDLLRPPSAQCRLLPRPRTAHQPEGFGEGADLSCTPLPLCLFRLACRERGCQGPQTSRGRGLCPGVRGWRQLCSYLCRQQSPSDGEDHQQDARLSDPPTPATALTLATDSDLVTSPHPRPSNLADPVCCFLSIYA